LDNLLLYGPHFGQLVALQTRVVQNVALALAVAPVVIV